MTNVDKISSAPLVNYSSDITSLFPKNPAQVKVVWAWVKPSLWMRVFIYLSILSRLDDIHLQDPSSTALIQITFGLAGIWLRETVLEANGSTAMSSRTRNAWGSTTGSRYPLNGQSCWTTKQISVPPPHEGGPGLRRRTAALCVRTSCEWVWCDQARWADGRKWICSLLCQCQSLSAVRFFSRVCVCRQW